MLRLHSVTQFQGWERPLILDASLCLIPVFVSVSALAAVGKILETGGADSDT